MSQLRSAEVAERLHRWRLDQMQYDAGKPQRTASSDDLQQLCCGRLLDVWMYITDNIHSLHTVHTVKGNIELHSSGSAVNTVSGRNDQLERDEIDKSLQSVSSEIEAVQADIARLGNDITYKNVSLCELTEAARRNQRLSVCYGAVSRDARRRTDRVRQAVDCLHGLSPGGPTAAADRCDRMSAQPAVNSCMSELSECVSVLTAGIDTAAADGVSPDCVQSVLDQVRQSVSVHSVPDLLRCYTGLQLKTQLALDKQLLDDNGCSTLRLARVSELNSAVLRWLDVLHSQHLQWSVDTARARKRHRHTHKQLQLAADQLLAQLQEIDGAGMCGLPGRVTSVLQQENSMVQCSTLADTVLQLQRTSSCSARSTVLQHCRDITTCRQHVTSELMEVTVVKRLYEAAISDTRTAQLRSCADLQARTELPVQQLQEAHRQLQLLEAEETHAAGEHVKRAVRWVQLQPGSHVLSSQLLLQQRAPRLRSCPAWLLEQLRDSWLRRRQLVTTRSTNRLTEEMARCTDYTDRITELRVRVGDVMKREVTSTLPRLKTIRSNCLQVQRAIEAAALALRTWREEPAGRTCMDIQCDGLTLQQWQERYSTALAIVKHSSKR